MNKNIEIWKEKYGEYSLFEIKLNTENGVVKGVFRKPTLLELEETEKKSKKSESQGGVYLFEACFLSGDERLKKEDDLKISCMPKIAESFKIVEAEVKKL